MRFLGRGRARLGFEAGGEGAGEVGELGRVGHGRVGGDVARLEGVGGEEGRGEGGGVGRGAAGEREWHFDGWKRGSGFWVLDGGRDKRGCVV